MALMLSQQKLATRPSASHCVQSRTGERKKITPLFHPVAVAPSAEAEATAVAQTEYPKRAPPRGTHRKRLSAPRFAGGREGRGGRSRFSFFRCCCYRLLLGGGGGVFGRRRGKGDAAEGFWRKEALLEEGDGEQMAETFIREEDNVACAVPAAEATVGGCLSYASKEGGSRGYRQEDFCLRYSRKRQGIFWEMIDQNRFFFSVAVCARSLALSPSAFEWRKLRRRPR